MKTPLMMLISATIISQIGWAQAPASYDIETVEVAPKGTRASEEDQDLGNMYNGPAVTIEREAPAADQDGAKQITPLSQRSSARDAYEAYGYESALEMRARRRVGVGFATSGQMGLMGAMVDMNFTPENSVILGFGGGPKYNAFAFHWKHIFGGKVFSPYSNLGYARWYNASGQNGGISKTNPTYLASKFMSDEEKRTGKFSVDLLTPSLGIQYNQLVGPYMGTSVFMEIMLLTSIDNMKQVPTASLGMLYYF